MSYESPYLSNAAEARRADIEAQMKRLQSLRTRVEAIRADFKADEKFTQFAENASYAVVDFLTAIEHDENAAQHDIDTISEWDRENTQAQIWAVADFRRDQRVESWA